MTRLQKTIVSFLNDVVINQSEYSDNSITEIKICRTEYLKSNVVIPLEMWLIIEKFDNLAKERLII